MLNEKELQSFFDKLTSEHPTIRDLSYDEYRIIYTIKNSPYKKEKIEELFNSDDKQMILDNDIIQYYLMSTPETPENIVREMIDNIVSVDTLLKVFERYDIPAWKDSDKIYHRVYSSLFPETIKEYLCTESVLKKNWSYIHSEPINKKVSQSALEYLAQQDDLSYYPVMLIRDGLFAKKLMEEHPDDEKLRTAIINNERLNDDIRNEAFDKGCIAEDIKYGTPYIVASMYESAMDTLSIENNVETKIYQNALTLLERLLEKDLLTESQQLDIVLRYANERNNGYRSIYEETIKRTKFESVYDAVIKEFGGGDLNHPAISKIYFGLYTPHNLLKKRAEYVIDSVKDNAMFGLETEKLIYKTLSQGCLKNKKAYESLINCNHYGFNSVLVQDPNVPNEQLRQLIKKCHGTNQYSTMLVAALNIGMNYEDRIEKHRSLFFDNITNSIMQTSPKELYNIINGAPINGNIPIIQHHLKGINKDSLKQYMLSAKEELKNEKPLQDLLDKLIIYYEESFKKDDLYEKISLVVEKYNGENNKVKFSDEHMRFVFNHDIEKYNEVFSQLSHKELTLLENSIISSIPHLSSDIPFQKTWTHFYENVDNYVKLDDILSQKIKEKEIEIKPEIEER